MRKISDIMFRGVLKTGEYITKKNRNKVAKYGSEYGGWYLPEQLKLGQDDICIAAGAGEDISFECELAQRFQGSIFIIDPTPRAVEHYKALCAAVLNGNKFRINNQDGNFYEISADNLERINYFQYGLSFETCRKRFYFPENEEWVSCSLEPNGKSEKFFEAECLKYSDFLERYSFNKKNIRIVKMDIEGSEYDVIKGMIKEDILPEILCFEIHKLNKKSVHGILNLFWSLKRAGMELFYVTGQDILWVRKAD